MTVNQAAALLNVDVTATERQIKNAHRGFARRFHPDKNPNDPGAHSRMVAANHACKLLLDYASSKDGRLHHRRKKEQHATILRTHPAAKHHVVWSGPLKAKSEFFEIRGFILRPTDGRVGFRAMKDGRQHFSLERHPDDQAILVCRNETGDFIAIDGVGFWADDGVEITPYAEASL